MASKQDSSLSLRHGRTIFLLLCGAVFAWMFLLNCLTPYIADDFTFAYAFDTGERLTGLGSLLSSLAFHYMEWTGRVVVKFFAQGFTLFPKVIFNLFNAAAYTGLGLVLYRLARGSRKGWDTLLLLSIYIGLWLCLPAFGQTNLWMCGSCNYLWASLGCLSYLLVWGKYLRQPFSAGVPMAVGMAVAGLFVGWLSENTSAGVLVALVLSIAAVPLLHHRRPPLWMFTGLLGACIGFAILILAPGNYNRNDVSPDTRPLLTKVAVRFLTACNMLKGSGMVLLCLIALLSVAVWFTRREHSALIWPAILFAAAMGANFAMVGSPVYYARSCHGVYCLLIATAASLLVLLERPVFRQIAAAALAVCCVPAAFAAVEGGYDIASYYIMVQQREQLIEQAAADGEMHIETYSIACYTPYCAAWGLPDVRTDSTDSIGLCRARWYGVWRVEATEVHTYPFPGKTPAYDDDMLSLLTEAQLAELQDS